VFNITTYGAVGDGSTLNTAAIQAAVDACHNAGGGVVEVPAGNFLTGTIFLKSNVEFHISQSGTITGSTNISHYPVVSPAKRTYTDNYPQRSVFYAEGQHNISITGEGTFTGNGQALTFLLDMDNRPYGFRFMSCSNIRYEGLKLRHSAFWMMHNFDVDTLVIKNLNIVNHGFGNNDGINIDGCRKVLVDSIFADCNDDPMVMKTTALVTCEDVEIKNCTVATYSRALKMGTETNGPYKNIYVHNCKVQQSTAGPLTEKASCGINLSAVDGGSMENVLFESIEMTGVNTPFFIRLGNRARKYTDTAAVQGVGYVRNVELRNITATASNNVTSSITGIPGYDVKNVLLKNIDITFPGGWPALPGNYTVPENEADKPEANIFGDTLPACGLYIRHVDSIRLQNVCFHPLQPDARPTYYLDDVTNYDTTLTCGNTAINNIQHSTMSLMVFPNPVTGNVLFTDYNGHDVVADRIFNVTGSVVASGNLVPDLAINVSNLQPGVYLLQAYMDGLTRQNRFIKQ